MARFSEQKSKTRQFTLTTGIFLADKADARQAVAVAATITEGWLVGWLGFMAYQPL